VLGGAQVIDPFSELVGALGTYKSAFGDSHHSDPVKQNEDMVSRFAPRLHRRPFVVRVVQRGEDMKPGIVDHVAVWTEDYA
jgi:hypothetical protein